MKSKSLLIFAILGIVSCARQGATDGPVTDKWNGYGKYLKCGEQVHNLRAGKHNIIGTVTYGIDNDANFYVTYDCGNSGWKFSETHMFAGDKKNMPLNRPGCPKVGKFPYSHNHCPRVTTYTYRIPLNQLPPCEAPGFVVAAHAVVLKGCNKIETAWAEGDYTFTDKGWGWYDDYYYNTPSNPSVILYGTERTEDTLKLYHIDVVNNTSELILKEYVGNTGGTYDGAAYDNVSGTFLFTNYSTGQLWVNHLQDEAPSFCAGTLTGTAASGTFHEGSYYYVNQGLNTINKVNFSPDWLIAGETVLDTIPSQVTVNDIAMSPGGDILYILGHHNGGGAELISWSVTGHQFYTTSISLDENAQIAFGSDGALYAIGDEPGGDNGSMIYLIETESAVLTPIDEIIIVIPDGMLSDLAGGPGN